MRAAVDGHNLPSHGRAADNQRGSKVERGAEFFEDLVDLHSQLARGQDNQALFFGRGDLLDQGQGEGQGFARAGLGDADNIFAGQCPGNGLALDRGGVD